VVVVETIDYRLHHHHRSFPQILWPFGRENSVHGQPKRKKKLPFLKKMEEDGKE
jgi:hypothetical protein